jgi:hypothetical protein
MPLAAQQALQRANRLMEVGDFVNAAPIYEQLGRGAHDQGHPRQAAHLYMQAGRAFIFSGQVQQGQILLREGLGILAQAEQWEAFDRAGARAVGELDLHGQPQAAQDLAKWIESIRQDRTKTTLPPQESSESGRLGAVETRRARLPLKCPSCGAPLRPDEIEWFDDITADCAYCGSGIQAG